MKYMALILALSGDVDHPKFRELVEAGRRHEGIQQIIAVNQAVNFAIKPINEEVDYWASPLETLTSGQGDCEDYALVKIAVFKALNVPVRLSIVQERKAYHAVVVVSFQGHDLVLDNRHNRVTHTR